MIIIEGIDGVGKTTLVDYFVRNDMKKHHFGYDAKNLNLMAKYLKILDEDTRDLVLDRSFISEMVYGPVLRGICKLKLEEYKNLLLEFKKVGTKIIYLTAPKEILLQRRAKEEQDYTVISNHYDELKSYYDSIIEYSKDYIDVLEYDTADMCENEVQSHAKRLILK